MLKVSFITVCGYPGLPYHTFNEAARRFKVVGAESLGMLLAFIFQERQEDQVGKCLGLLKHNDIPILSF